MPVPGYESSWAMAAAQDPETYARLKAAYFELEALPAGGPLP